MVSAVFSCSISSSRPTRGLIAAPPPWRAISHVFVRLEPAAHELSKKAHRQAICRAENRSRITISDPQRGQYQVAEVGGIFPLGEGANASLASSSRHKGSRRARQPRSEELARPALEFVRTKVTERLNKSGISNRLLWDPSYRRQSLHVVPTSLAAALWLQFARTIEGDKEHRQCEQCNRWFEVAAEKREDAKFCQNACRSKAYRERQKTARKLRGEGMTVWEIARRLDSDTKTITRWTKK